MNIFEKIHGTVGLFSVFLGIVTLFAAVLQLQYVIVVAIAFVGSFSIFVVMALVGFLSLIWS